MSDKDETVVLQTPEEVNDAAKGHEGEEKPVREKLEHAAISSQRGSVSPDGSDTEMQQDARAGLLSVNGKDKPMRKRSLEDLKEVDPAVGSLDAPATPSSGTHLRKKTREQKDAEGDGEVKLESVAEAAPTTATSTPPSDSETAPGNASPRKKRSAEDMEEIASHKQKVAATEEAQIARKSLDDARPTFDAAGIPTQSNGTASAAHEEDAPQKSKTSTNGGFSNSSVTSPFGAFGAKTASESKGNGSLSGFGAFSGSGSKSPFAGAAGGVSPFGASGAIQSTGKVDAPKMSFASAPSPFTAGGGFGGAKLNSFASSKGDFSGPPATSKLSPFASPGGGDLKSAQIKLSAFASPGGGDFGAPSKTKGKPFGAPADEKSDVSESDVEDGDTESRAEGTETESRAGDEAEKSHGPKVPEGEEEEETLWTNRAKIYALVDGGWKERGVGVFKLNIHRDSDLAPDEEDLDNFEASHSENTSTVSNGAEEDDLESGQKSKESDAKTVAVEKGRTPPRFIMRAMQTQRLILNVPVSKEMKLGDPQDLTKPPLSKHIMFGVPESGVIVKYLLKVGREEELQILYKKVKLVQKKL